MKNKIWYKLYTTIEGKKVLLAKVRSKGLAYITKQAFENIYGKVDME